MWEPRAFRRIYKRKSTILKQRERKQYPLQIQIRQSNSHRGPLKRIFVCLTVTLLTCSGLVSRFEEKRSPPFSKPTAFSVKTIIARARGLSCLLMLSRAAARPIWATGGTNKQETMAMLHSSTTIMCNDPSHNTSNCHMFANIIHKY